MWPVPRAIRPIRPIDEGCTSRIVGSSQRMRKKVVTNGATAGEGANSSIRIKPASVSRVSVEPPVCAGLGSCCVPMDRLCPNPQALSSASVSQARLGPRNSLAIATRRRQVDANVK